MRATRLGEVITATAPLLLLAALAAASVAQGGFYRQGQLVIALLLALSAGAAFWSGRLQVTRSSQAVLVGAAALGATSVLSAALAGHIGGAVSPLLLLAAISAIVVVVGSSDAQQRGQLGDGLVVLGAAVAGSGLFGVIFRVSPLAHVDGDLWRAATTVTYANAAAGLLAMLSIIALARLVSRPGLVTRSSAIVIVVGLFATLSRAGLICAALGCVVLTVKLGLRTVLRHCALPLLGATLAGGLIALSMPVGSTPRPALALLGLFTGVALGSCPTVPSWRVVRAGAALCLFGVAVAVVRLAPSLPSVWSARASLASPDRLALTRSAWRVFKGNSLTGAGPGNVTYFFLEPPHRLFADRYAHNEYLQLAAEQGIAGLAALGAATAVVILVTRRIRAGVSQLSHLRDVPTAAGVAAAAALICFALESSVDFLWHVPAVVLVAAVVLALGLPPSPHALPSRSPSLVTTTKEQS